MINKKSNCISEIIVSNEGYFQPTINRKLLLGEYCEGCHKIGMSRIAMSCYAAATRHPNGEGIPKEKPKPKTTKYAGYEEVLSGLSLDKYNQKLMNSIWGLYNRNSPHNFKKQNAENAAIVKGQETIKSSYVQFSVPQFHGILSMSVEVGDKPKTSSEKFDNMEQLFSFPAV